MIEFSGRMSRVFLKKIQLFFIFFEKTAKTPLPATMSTLYQHSAPPAHPPRPGNFFREARNFSRRRENFPREGNFFSPTTDFFLSETIFSPPRRISLCRGGVFHTSRGVPRRFCRPEEAFRAPYMRLYTRLYMPSGRSTGGPPRRIHRQEACWKRSQYAFWACIFAIYLEQSNKEFSTELFSATPV